jgi:hypothetical protein
MGTFAVGGGAYALMPRDNCERPPNVASPSLLQSNAECPPRGSSSGGSHGGSGGGRSYYSSDSSSSHSASSTSDSGSSHVTRGGFGIDRPASRERNVIVDVKLNRMACGDDRGLRLPPQWNS